MARVVVTESADADIAEIDAYLSLHAGRRVALRYLDDFDAFYERLAKFPDMGPTRSDLGAHIRVWSIHPFVIIYRHIADTVEILRVLHGKRDITSQVMTR